jgi:hypothetical protein
MCSCYPPMYACEAIDRESKDTINKSNIIVDHAYLLSLQIVVVAFDAVGYGKEYQKEGGGADDIHGLLILVLLLC